MRLRLSLMLIFSILWIFVASDAFALSKPRYAMVHFKIVEHGSFLIKSGKEATSKEARAALVAACAYFGADCRNISTALGVVAKELSLRGEEHRGAIYSPKGYVLCKATPSDDHAGHVNRTTFNTTYNSTPKYDGLDYYAVVPKYQGRGYWIETNISLMYVKSRDRKAYHCLVPGTHPWLCPWNWRCSFGQAQYY